MSSRTVALIGNYLPDRQESMLRFGQLLADGMQSRGWSVQTWRPEPRFTKLISQYRYSGIPKYLGYLDKFYVFPRVARKRQRAMPSDTVYHIVDHGNAMYASHFNRARLLTTCHDLLQVRSAFGEFPQNRVSRSGQRYQQWILDWLKRSERVACVSHKTRDDLVRLTGLPSAKVDVVYLGLNYNYRPMPPPEATSALTEALHRNGFTAVPAFGLGYDSFLLGVGGAQWYKNRAGVLSTFAALQRRAGAPKHLIFVGPPFEPEVQQIIDQYSLGSSVYRLSGVSNEELRAAYSLAVGLLFPSWEEGFGWPIVEAQACGCPVFTSNRAPMNEIAGPAACLVDPGDPEAAADAIARALPRLAEMREEGLRQSTRWTASAMLDRYEQIYEELAGARGRLSAASV